MKIVCSAHTVQSCVITTIDLYSQHHLSAIHSIAGRGDCDHGRQWDLKHIEIYWNMCVVYVLYLCIYFAYQYNSIHISEEMIYNSYTVYTGQNIWHCMTFRETTHATKHHKIVQSFKRPWRMLLLTYPEMRWNMLMQSHRWFAPQWASHSGPGTGKCVDCRLKKSGNKVFSPQFPVVALVIDFVQAFGSCTCTDSFYIPPTKSLSNAHQQPRSSLAWFSHGPLEVRWILIPRGPNQDQSRSA